MALGLETVLLVRMRDESLLMQCMLHGLYTVAREQVSVVQALLIWSV